MTTLPRWLRQLLPAARSPSGVAPDPDRWVVVDVEASGLDLRHNRLLSIAALAVRPRVGQPPEICIGDSFEVVLQQEEADLDLRRVNKENILVHGIGVQAQRQGVPPDQAMQGFLDFMGHSPLVAFHTFFDQTLIERTLRQVGLQAPPNPWVDLEHVGAVLTHSPRRHSLDEWMERYGIRCIARHQASADTLATAELLVRLWPQLVDRKATSWHELVRLAENAQMLPGRFA